MEILTVKNLVRRDWRGPAKNRKKDSHKVVSIADYRGVVFLPGRHNSSTLAFTTTTGPLSAA